MSCKPHPAFTPPDDENARIWRYIDLWKLVSLLDTHALFFPKTMNLGVPLEGTVPRRTAKRLAAMDAKAFE